MTRIILIMLITLFSTVMHAAQENCWDGSFAYRVASVVHKNGQIEVGFGASLALYTDLGLPAERMMRDINGMPVDQPGTNMMLYLSFDESECQTLADGNFVCDVDVPYDNQFNNKRVFVKRMIDNFGETIPIISLVPVSEFGVEISKENATAFIKYGHENIAMINVPKRICDVDGQAGGTFFGTAYFPQELTDYVRR